MTVNPRSIAIVLARGGSKRIPRKNIKDFCGKPMIAWVLEEARESGLFTHVMVSTDDAEIADVAGQWGAEVPFLRPAELSDDYASTDQVLQHVLRQCQNFYGNLQYACCLYPVSPFLTRDDLSRTLDLLITNQATAAFPVVRFDFPIEQAFQLDGARLRSRWPEQLDERSQDLPDHYHDAGMFYWVDVPRFLEVGQLFCEDAVATVLSSDRCQDINTFEDWEHAELKFRILAERANT